MSAVEDVYTDEGRMAVAREVARYMIGDPSWANLLIGAYQDPERALRDLAALKADR